jgi:hypothetical protein
MIEQAIYDRIKTVTSLVRPTQPESNDDFPCLVYTVTASEPQRTLTGSGSLVKYTVQIESWADTAADANALLAGVRSALDGYAGGFVHRAFWNGQDTQEEDDAYHGVSTYTVWLSTANVVPQVGTKAVIRTGENSIELETCDRTLRLDCDGLSLDGEEVGGGGVQPPHLTLITDWTLHFTTSQNPERVGIFKYVNKRNKAHRRSPAFGWSGTPYTPHQGKRWELVFELATTATTWTYPTSYAGSVRPHDNDPFPNSSFNLRTSGKAKRWRVGAMHGGAWHLSPEVLMYSVNAFRFDPTATKLGLVS